MTLEIYHIILLISIGAVVGISISFIGQTGQGVVLPIVLLITGDVFLAIALNLLNDLIASASSSIRYIKKKEFNIRKDIFIIIIIGIFISILGVFILMTTPLGNIFAWFIPLFITCLGFVFVRKGFPTAEKLNNIVQKLITRIKSNNVEAEKFNTLKEQRNDHVNNEQEIKGVIPSGSRLYYILSLIFGTIIGINSGLFGANSGLVFVLALVMIYGYPLKKGVGTALILSMVMCFSTFLIYQILGLTIKGQVYFNFEISIYLAIGSIISGFIVSSYVQKMSATTMGRAVGIVISALGLLSLIFYFIT